MTATEHDTADLVVLLDDDGHPTGTAPRLTVHGRDTPLHLAFSLYVVDAAGRLLLTRRALGKRTWPGVWTNACCGHPRPDEDVADAARRRVAEELGLTITAELRELLPDFRYRAVDASGVVEHEICPVFLAEVDAPDLSPDPDEVVEHTWAPWPVVRELAARAPALISPWLAAQVAELIERGPDDDLRALAG